MYPQVELLHALLQIVQTYKPDKHVPYHLIPSKVLTSVLVPTIIKFDY